LVISAGVMGRRETCTDGYSYACPVLGLPDGIRGCQFVLDGVLMKTAKAHDAAWKEMFDGYLHERARQSGQPFVPFDPVADYGEYAGGMPRAEGTRSFPKSRRIELLGGREDDPPGAQTVYGLATARTRSCWGGSVRTACKRARARPVTSGLSETRGCAAGRPALTAAACLPRLASRTCSRRGSTAWSLCENICKEGLLRTRSWRALAPSGWTLRRRCPGTRWPVRRPAVRALDCR